MHYLAFFDPAVYQPHVTIVTCDEDLQKALSHYKGFTERYPEKVQSVEIGECIQYGKEGKVTGELTYEKVKAVKKTAGFESVGFIKFGYFDGGYASLNVYVMKVSKGKPVLMALR